MAVADRLAEDHHVRRGLLRLETPIGVAKPAKPGLHLIGDTQATGRPHPFIDGRKIAGRRLDLATDTRKALGDKPCQSMATFRQRADGPLDIGGVFFAGLRIVIAEAAAIGVGKLGNLHPVRRAVPAGPVEFIGADVNRTGRVAVIGMVLDDHTAPPGMGTRQPQRQFIRLRSRGDEIAMGQMRRKFRPHRVGKLHLQRMDIACVGIEKPALTLDYSGNAWMRVSDMRHVVVGVQMGTPMLVIEIVPPAAQDLQRLAV